uniref:Pyruvate kinase n=1 Tax=Sargassum thunbergii TaxID=127542 RepID=A0A097IU80_9PHAE|nr:pyruvate kinase [Sargassum thunbergii]
MHRLTTRISSRVSIRYSLSFPNAKAKVPGERGNSSIRGLVPESRRSVQTLKAAPSMAKIVATIGPTSEEFEPLQQIVDAGMRVMRINFSHATFEEAEKRLTNLRACKGKDAVASLGEQHNVRGVLLDTQGPEIRTGNLEGNAKISLEQGSTIELTTDPAYRDLGSSSKVFVNYSGLPRAVNVGSPVLVDDGLISLRVTDVRENAVMCIVENSATLKSRRGVNLPGAKVDLPALSEKDKIDITYGIENDIDFVASSFVRKGDDVRSIRHFIGEVHKRFWPDNRPPARIISKIESMEAVDNFDDILELSDGIMVARGDLGVEIPAEQVTNMQKKMVRACNRVGKPVIVATQMLESMQNNPRPTRAEVSDVTNAVYDGADAVMLSGESAQGKYPVESVEMMRRIIEEAETWRRCNPDLVLPDAAEAVATSEMEGIASAAVHAADSLKAKLIVVVTRKGHMARLVAKFRPNVPVLCPCPDIKVARQLVLHRGLQPLIFDHPSKPSEQPHAVVELAKSGKFCQPGDTVVVAFRDYDSIDKDLTLKILNVA